MRDAVNQCDMRLSILWSHVPVSIEIRQCGELVGTSTALQDPGEGIAMLELTDAQVSAMKAQRVPLHLVDPETREVYVLIRKDVYELTCGIVAGGGRPRLGRRC